MENFKVDSRNVYAQMQNAKNTPIQTKEDVDDNYHFDDQGNAYKRCPLAVKWKKERQSGVKVDIDESTTPCYYLFAMDGRQPILVTKDFVEARDKNAWFLTEREALEAKAKSLASKRKDLEGELKKASKKKKVEVVEEEIEVQD